MKTYILDIDGTIVPNMSIEDLEREYPNDAFIQNLLPGVQHFFTSLTDGDKVIFTTSRIKKYRDMTIRTLKHNNIKYDHLIMDLPNGERILINDVPDKSIKKIAIAINVPRNSGFQDSSIFDDYFQ